MQAGGITKELLRELARANGVNLPEERLDAVLRQYQNYLRALARIDTLPLPREVEPEILFLHRPQTEPGRQP